MTGANQNHFAILLMNVFVLCSGSKRKFVDSLENSSGAEIDDEYLQSIESDIVNAISKIKDGSHTELQSKAHALNRAKENKMAAADRHRKMQIKNINLQYEYDLEDANALYNVSNFIAFLHFTLTIFETESIWRSSR